MGKRNNRAIRAHKREVWESATREQLEFKKREVWESDTREQLELIKDRCGRALQESKSRRGGKELQESN